MATQASKRRANFEDDYEVNTKRHRPIGEDDRARMNGGSARGQGRGGRGDRKDGGRGGHAYRDPFGGGNRADWGRRDDADFNRNNRRRSPPRSPRRDGRRDQRSRSPARRSGDNRNGSRQTSPPPRGPRSARSPDRRRPEDGARRRDETVAHKDSSKLSSSHKDNEKKRTGSKSQPKDVDLTEDEEEAAMRRFMGFINFKTTKNTKVPGNDKNYAVRKEKKAEYRQYMNRVGGFNRPLSPS